MIGSSTSNPSLQARILPHEQNADQVEEEAFWEEREEILKYLKPALKRNTLHMRNNVIVSWKSFEIWVIQQGVDLASSKILNPLYVPMEEATKML